MEKNDIDISVKNVGSVSWENYIRRIIQSGDDVISRMRWKLFYFKRNKRKKQQQRLRDNETYDNVIDNHEGYDQKE